MVGSAISICRSESPAAPPILCMLGLTRNSADFAALADYLGARYRVIAVDQRRRGRSDYDPAIDTFFATL